MVFKTKYPNCRQNFNKTRPVARFQDLEHNIFLGGNNFVFIICLKQIFLSTTKFGRAQKIWGHCPPVSAGLSRTLPESLPLGASCLCRGAGHSENLNLIRKHSTCRLCKLNTNIFPQIPIIGSWY